MRKLRFFELEQAFGQDPFFSVPRPSVRAPRRHGAFDPVFGESRVSSVAATSVHAKERYRRAPCVPSPRKRARFRRFGTI